MNKVYKALKQALEACLDIRILFLLFVPFLLSLIIGIILFFTVGVLWITSASGVIEHSWFMQYISQNWQVISEGTVASLAYIITMLIAFLVILPVSYLFAILVVSVILLPIILKILERSDFAGIEKKRGGSVAYSLWNTLKVSAIYMVTLIITAPFWLFPGFAIAIPILLSAYLNKNIFVYDVLQDYATEEERKKIEKDNWGLLYILGIILGFFNYLPLAFVVAPAYASLAYSYFCLNELKELRENRS